MVKKHNLSLSAAQIDENLVKAGQAVLFIKQELTEEQKEQVRQNIGADESKFITNIDFSNFENGSFTETIDGQIVTHEVDFDGSGRPIKIDGVTITWNNA